MFVSPRTRAQPSAACVCKEPVGDTVFQATDLFGVLRRFSSGTDRPAPRSRTRPWPPYHRTVCCRRVPGSGFTPS